MANFLTIFRKYKTSSILNILGLTAAFAALYLILVQVHYDFTYNQSIKDSERIYLLSVPGWEENSGFMAWVSRPMCESTIEGSPVVESAGCGYTGNSVSAKDYCIQQNGAVQEIKLAINTVSLPWLDVFGYKATSGSFQALEQAKSIAISESIAKRYGLKVGDIIYSGNKVNAEFLNTIVAIFPQMTGNNDLNTTEAVQNIGEAGLKDWSQWSYNYFIKLKSLQDVQVFCEHAAKKQREVLIQRGTSSGEDIEKELKKIEVKLTPISETYFSEDVQVPGRFGNKATTYTLLTIAMLVVLIALINFVNFFFALVPVRIRSVNTKKVFGCPPASLRMGFIGEALGVVFIALILAWICVDLIKTSTLAGYISAPLALSENGIVVGMTLLAAIGIALAASIYPSYYITSFPAAMVLKGSFSASKNGKRLRTFLIGLQFVISIGMIISTLLIKSQHAYMMNYDMGFNKEMLLSCYLPGKITRSVETRETFSNKLKENPQIKELAYGAGNFISVGRMGWGRGFKGKTISLQCMPVSWDFLRVMGIEVIEGRDFTKEDEFKENGTFIFNEQAAKEYEITLEDKVSGHDGPTDVAGICKNFNFKPLQYAISPFSFYIFGKDPWQMPNHLYLRTIENADIPAVIENIKSTILAFAPEVSPESINVEFFDQELERQYESEQRLTTLITLFTLLSIIISLMGVFGLVLFETQYRKREIGLRRVHGATVMEILNIFNLKFIRIVGICFVIAAPLSYLAIDRWLDNFAYRTPIQWWIFAIALVAVMGITVTLVSLRSLSAATDNPVDAIKAE